MSPDDVNPEWAEAAHRTLAAHTPEARRAPTMSGDRAAISALVLTAMGDAWTDSEEYSALPGVVADLLLTSDWLAAEKAKWQAEALEAEADRTHTYHFSTGDETRNVHDSGTRGLLRNQAARLRKGSPS